MSWRDPPTLPRHWQLGTDILNDMVSAYVLPQWERNDEGSVHVPNLGNIKMKRVDWNRWCNHTFQTCLWLGTSIPSKASQNRSRGEWAPKGGRGGKAGR